MTYGVPGQSRTPMQMSKKQAALVMVGNKIKLRLEENREITGNQVSIDWLRFTAPLRLNHDHIFPEDLPEYARWLNLNARENPELGIGRWHEHHALQARWMAEEVCHALGAEYYVDALIKRGRDFYKYRISIMRENHECGWVGFISATTSEHKAKQDKTLHVNLYGHACTFGQTGWQAKMQTIIRAEKATITRVDLAMDDFDCRPGFLQSVKEDYQLGLMDSGGKRLKCNMVGCWLDDGTGHSRSFYIGSKEAGKQTNVYEKGHQLFGAESGSTWTRIELRYGNKLRDIPAKVLTEPDQYFAGASDWHATQLREYKLRNKIYKSTAPEGIKTKGRLPIETVEAEAYRNAKWVLNICGASLQTAFTHLSENQFLEIICNKEKPGRLRKYSDSEIRGVYQKAFTRLTGTGAEVHA